MSMLVEIDSGSHIINEDASIPDTIERINSAMTYDDFFCKYLIPNRPCLIESGIIENWPCRNDWVLDGSPNFEALRASFGHHVVPVADCNKRFYNSQFKNDMSMTSYLDYWINYKRSDYAESMPLLYLKDWHCMKDHPDGSLIYEVPRFFASDWLNEYYIAHPKLNDDYMFIYMGPKGSWTPLHADVFTSYSWSANIVGRKRWLLFPPREEDCLRDLHGQLAYDAASEELNDSTKYKAYDSKRLKCLDVIQEIGEIIFVPSGWHHQVWNLEDTISINHNWINGCNIASVWLTLKRELASVMKEVDDCRDMKDWSEHCQLMLKTSYGMDYRQFFEFISFIAKNRLQATIKRSQVISFDARNLSVYNLMCENNEAHVLLRSITSLLNKCSSYNYKCSP